MTTAEAIRVSPTWLGLREPADATARSHDLVRRLPAAGLQFIHDLGCGSGAMGRWLAPLLPGPQHWVLHDRDADLLALAETDRPGRAADGSEVTVETRASDVTRLDADELAGATLLTASALLDLLTADELSGLTRACAGAACPVLLTLSVTGCVQFAPEDPLDSYLEAAFNAHQRRETPRGRLLGPDAVEEATVKFRRLGAEVIVSPSPWRLGAVDTRLTAAWLAGWVDAACDQEPALAADADRYRRRRLSQAEAGSLAVTVGHVDLLVLP
jgi:hypothetical protein